MFNLVNDSKGSLHLNEDMKEKHMIYYRHNIISSGSLSYLFSFALVFYYISVLKHLVNYYALFKGSSGY